MRIILLGPPGAGKGTQAAFISERFSIPSLSTGDILRRTADGSSALAKDVKRIMSSGSLMPDETMIDIMREELSSPHTQNGFILDGFPRTTAQAASLSELFSEMEINADAVIYFNVPSDYLLRRVTGRYACKSCGKGYHKEFLKPQREGICDNCGGTEFVSRNDDNETALKSRLDAYYEKTEPLVAYYREKDIPFLDIDGTRPIEDVKNTILTALMHTKD